ncbi:MAG: HDIG domain-containing protein [Treponema sp.]|jgi:putative nucleotidyltransferase with HDIG domain|nr:HDIG domain-containing protein [Treponema sp.]
MNKHTIGLNSNAFFSSLKPGKLRTGPALAAASAFILTLTVVIGSRGRAGAGSIDLAEFEAGKVSERDVAAQSSISYVDEQATQQQFAVQERMIPAVFTYSNDISAGMREAYARFAALALEYAGPSEAPGGADAFYQAVAAAFPNAFSEALLRGLYREQRRAELPELGSRVLETLLEAGIFTVPAEVPQTYNPEFAELRHNYGPRTEREQIRYDRILTIHRVDDAIARYIADNALPPAFSPLITGMVKPFITENVFFSAEAMAERVQELKDTMEPVVKYLERGKRIIRKGFIVTEDNIMELRALNSSRGGVDVRMLAGQALALALLFALLLFLAGPRNLKRTLKPAEAYLVCILSAAYITASVGVKNLAILGALPAALFLPTPLVVMLASMLISPSLALVMAMILPLGALLAGSFDAASCMVALSSGFAAVYTLRGAERRLDLVKAGSLVGGVNLIAVLAALLLYREAVENYPLILFWAVFNGAASGMLVLGFLPILEKLLNSVTTFRLIELADLNAPILKRLFNAASGTYSHSLMVASLAENACQEIGANALLARVGAYYHDIGKMEQPDYFVENQTAYNKHDDIAPRLSATVIRSHVKLGVEKARNLGLPKEVVDIVAEHHGNSVITYFYHEALKREGQVNIEDFSYPGMPPRSRESAVVMLADVTEAAARTLKKPTASRLEKFIRDLIMAKFEHDQLSASELTFRDLETIKKSFVRVLAGYYHSRIEYPKPAQKEGQASDAADPPALAAEGEEA